MSDNKFIRHLRGEDTAKSVLEIKNQKTLTSFANMPDGTSNANDVYSDHRGNATGVLKGSENWKLNGSTLVESSTIYGDGRDFTNSFQASGNGLWVNTTCSFATEKRFAPNTKFVLKLCGHDLETIHNNTIDFTLIVNFGSGNLISKTFTVTEQAFDFCKEFVIDFAESNSAAIKIAVGDTMQVQLLCSDANARAVLYNGMTVFTALQRRVDGDAVASDTKTFPEIEQDIEDIYEDIDDLKDYVDDNFVNIDGTSIMTGPLKMRATSDFKCAIAPYWDGVGFFKLNDNNSVTLMASIEYRDSFTPAENNVYNIGAASKKWKNLYLSGKAFVATLNNGGDLTVPANTTGTLATKADVDLAANSGRMITDQGVWYAKMYAATVVPTGAEYDGKNYADFSQTDSGGNPVIKIYTGVSGAWTLTETITPPTEYDGYVPITSKIWDIAEQSGQQGGRILWNHQSKDFTPYPLIVSFDGQNITNSTFSYGTISYSYVNAIGGTMDNMTITNSTFSGSATLSGVSTVTMPDEPTNDQIVNKEYVDTHSGTSSFHPNLFDWKWADHKLNDMSWLRADTFSWQSGAVYNAAYKHLRNDMFNWASWNYDGTIIYTKKRYPEVGEMAYSNSSLTTEVGAITSITDDLGAYKIVVGGDEYSMLSGSNIAPTTETVAGVTIQYILAEDGHKIVTDFHTSEVEAIYAATGVAWYYIIDYGFYRFKLPRTQFGITGLRDTVGKFVQDGLPNITGDTPYVGACYNNNNSSLVGGAFASYDSGSGAYAGGGGYSNAAARLNFNASRSSSVYGRSDTVQPKATQMYLYFYVGEYTTDAVQNTAGLNAGLFNNKADRDFYNTSMIDFVVARQLPTAENNYTWYRKYRSGWVEQGGYISANNAREISSAVTLPVPMANMNYSVTIAPQSIYRTDTSAWNMTIGYYVYSATKLIVNSYGLGSSDLQIGLCWEVKGMAAS